MSKRFPRSKTVIVLLVLGAGAAAGVLWIVIDPFDRSAPFWDGEDGAINVGFSGTIPIKRGTLSVLKNAIKVETK